MLLKNDMMTNKKSKNKIVTPRGCFRNRYQGVSKMAEQVKELATKPANLSLISRTHLLGEN